MQGDSGRNRPRLAHLTALIFGVLALPVLSPVAPARAQESSPATKPAEKLEKPEKASEAADGPEARLKRIFDGEQVPEALEDLLAMQARIREIAERVIPCTVGVRVGGSQGSGVIVSKDGYVMTAGHVVSRPGLDVTLLLHDGRRVKGKTLGANYGIDSGLIKISADEEWPFVEMGDSASLKRGQWCLSTGHPGGFQEGRSAPLRVGRVLRSSESAVSTDCTLVGGDSGGPLFDMEGRVIGIHSRIGAALTGNIHVPVGTYKETWDRLAKSEAWGRGGRSAGGPFVGVQRDPDSEAAKIAVVVEGSPAENAGIRVGDVIVALDDKEISTFQELVDEVRKHKPKDKVKIVVQRGEEKLDLELVIGTRQS